LTSSAKYETPLSAVYAAFCSFIPLSSSLNVKGQILHPYKTIGKVMVLCFLIFMFLGSSKEDKRFLTGWLEMLPEFNLFLLLSCTKFDLLSQILEFCFTFKGSISYLHAIFIACILAMKQHVISFLKFTARPTSSASIEASVFLSSIYVSIQ
jgi:hypothetical protein